MVDSITYLVSVTLFQEAVAGIQAELPLVEPFWFWTAGPGAHCDVKTCLWH